MSNYQSKVLQLILEDDSFSYSPQGSGKGKPSSKPAASKQAPVNASWSQARKLWGFCAKEGINNTDWAKLCREGMVTSKAAAQILLKTQAYQAQTGGEREDSLYELAELIRYYFPDFKLKIEKAAEDSAAEAKRQAEEDAAAAAAEEEKERKPETFEPDGLPSWYVKPSWFDEVATMVKNGMQVMLQGGAGSGKSLGLRMIAKVLGLPYHPFPMSGGMRYAQVFGGKDMTDGNTSYTPSELLQDVQQKGLVNIDEILTAEPDVTKGLNSLTERSSRMIKTPGGTINVHPECVICSTANTKGRTESEMYAGDNVTDNSLLERFILYPVDYDEKTERGIVDRSGIPSAVADYFISKLKNMRKAIKENEIPFDASTRRLSTAVDLYKKCGFKKERSFELAFLSNLSDSELMKVED